MGRIEKVLCDQCEADISSTKEIDAFRIVLQSEALPHETNSRSMVYVQPRIREPKYFCDPDCLKAWVNKNLDDSYLRPPEAQSNNDHKGS